MWSEKQTSTAYLFATPHGVLRIQPCHTKPSGFPVPGPAMLPGMRLAHFACTDFKVLSSLSPRPAAPSVKAGHVPALARPGLHMQAGPCPALGACVLGAGRYGGCLMPGSVASASRCWRRNRSRSRSMSTGASCGGTPCFCSGRTGSDRDHERPCEEQPQLKPLAEPEEGKVALGALAEQIRQLNKRRLCLPTLALLWCVPIMPLVQVLAGPI